MRYRAGLDADASQERAIANALSGQNAVIHLLHRDQDYNPFEARLVYRPFIHELLIYRHGWAEPL